MRCENCKANIEATYVFAIKNNQCPACGKHIMAPEKLAAYASLKELLSSSFDDIDVDRVASLIVANFDLKQKFKEELQKSSEGGTIEVSEDDEDFEDMDPKVAADEADKKVQMAEAKKMSEKLKRMRNEALEGAMADHWGLGDANAFSDEETVHEIVRRQKQEQSASAVTTGSGKSAFTRS